MKSRSSSHVHCSQVCSVGSPAAASGWSCSSSLILLSLLVSLLFKSQLLWFRHQQVVEVEPVRSSGQVELLHGQHSLEVVLAEVVLLSAFIDFRVAEVEDLHSSKASSVELQSLPSRDGVLQVESVPQVGVAIHAVGEEVSCWKLSPDEYHSLCAVVVSSLASHAAKVVYGHKYGSSCSKMQVPECFFTIPSLGWVVASEEGEFEQV